MEFSDSSSLRHQSFSRVLVASFAGWSDAGDATSAATSHLIKTLDLDLAYKISGDHFTDLQMHRPVITRDPVLGPTIKWPDTDFFSPTETSLEGWPDDEPETPRVLAVNDEQVPEIFVLQGTEPFNNWEVYTEELIDLIYAWDIDLVIGLGSMFSDTPHSRPTPVTVTSEQQEMRDMFGALEPNYEGAIGVSTVLYNKLTQQDIPVVSIWAQVPHYVHSAPSPKVTLALLERLEETLNVVIPRGSLLDEATSWESNIDNLARQDTEMSSYIERLEEANDTRDATNISGEEIAFELQKFLNKKPDDFDDKENPNRSA